MQSNLHKRFPVSELSVIASILDPRLKDLRAVKAFLQTNGYKDKTDFILKFMDKYPTVQDEHAVEPGFNEAPCSSTKRVCVSLASLIERHSDTSAASNAGRIAEVHANLATPSTSVKDDILQFWRANGKLWPSLPTVAQAVFSIPATSTSVERLLSLSGNIITAKRSVIHPSLLNMLAFVHDNYDDSKDFVK